MKLQSFRPAQQFLRGPSLQPNSAPEPTGEVAPKDGYVPQNLENFSARDDGGTCRSKPDQPLPPNWFKGLSTAALAVPLTAAGALLGPLGFGPVFGAYQSGGVAEVLHQAPGNLAASLPITQILVAGLVGTAAYAIYQAFNDRKPA